MYRITSPHLNNGSDVSSVKKLVASEPNFVIPKIELPHEKQSIPSLKAQQAISSLVVGASTKTEKELWKGKEELSNYKLYKRLSKKIQVGWEVRFHYGNREREGKILAVSSRGVVVFVPILGSSNTLFPGERTSVKCERIIAIFKDK